MNLQSTREILYALEADIALKTNQSEKLLVQKALEMAHLKCQEIAEWLTTAEKRENQK